MTYASTQDQHQDTIDRRRSRVKATAGAVGAALAVWVVARFALGIEIASPEFGPDRPSETVGPVHVAGTALAASVAGWGLLAALERLTARARTIWTVIATGVLAFSLGGPFGGQGITTANQLALLAMHLAVGGVFIPRLRATSNPTAGNTNGQREADDRQPVAARA